MNQNMGRRIAAMLLAVLMMATGLAAAEGTETAVVADLTAEEASEPVLLASVNGDEIWSNTAAMQELIDYYQSSIERSRGLADSISDEDRVTAIVMGSSIGKVADGSMLQGKMLETAGAVNCAADLKATELWPTAGTEQIFSWDPDFIFITGSEGSVYSADDIYSDPAWSELKAVKNGHVVMIPARRTLSAAGRSKCEL